MPDNNKHYELLLLNAEQPLQCTNPNQWNAANGDSVKSFIDTIETSVGTDKEATEKYRTMISGVPSPWARVTITRKAIAFMPKRSDNVLALCYRTFRSEWRGLMAAYVLRADSFEFSDPIPLTGPTVEQNMGEMSVLETYGEMLFDDQPLWTLRREKLDRKKNPPCIQVLYFKNAQGERIPVGATSPFTFLFSSVNYDLSSSFQEIPWINDEGKFVDPTSGERSYLNDEEKRRLHAFLASVSSMILPSEKEAPDPDKYYWTWLQAVLQANEGVYHLDGPLVKEAIDSFRLALTQWADEIKASLEEVNPNVPVNTARPQGPLSILLNSEKVFYLSGSTLFTDPEAGRREIKSTEIFNESEFIAAWRESGDPAKSYADSCAYYLRAENQPIYFALPFTELALDVFSNAIGQIMDGTANIRLNARCVADSQVEVKLYAVLERQRVPVPVAQKTYRIEMIQEIDGKVFAWPNFRGSGWRNYYYYSEFPTNVSGIRMVPQFENGPKFLTSADRETNKDCYLVSYPQDKVDASAHKYEIIRTSQWLNSVQVWINKAGSEVLAGTLLMRQDKYVQPGTSPREAVVGIDFGSTNTCAYYKPASGGGDPKPIPFTNRRMAIVGFDNKQMELAQKDELLFISNEEPLNGNGQVKSWLHDHNLLYLTPTGRLSDVTKINEEIVGGVPVNESNISVHSMDRYTIRTNAGTLYYNMKWLAEETSLHRKTSFIRMLWLQICADLYAAEMIPSQLNWSFPSAMTYSGRNDLKSIFTDATFVSPFTAEYKASSSFSIKDYTEAEADCAFSIQKDTVDSHNIVLGIDVGGSTSDILIFGMTNGQSTLFTQSSVRIASGFFFDAIKSSSRFRTSLKNFHDSNAVDGLSVKGIHDIVSTDPEINGRAPYYLNNVFDQLKEEDDFLKFYRRLNADVRQVFALPAYVTGMLVFYCGMLVRNAIEQNKLDIQKVTIRHYGKGGRLFEWITSIYDLMGKNYYRDCFKAGVGDELAQKLDLAFGEVSKKESKSEVAIGLVSNIDQICRGEVDENEMRIIKNYDIVGEEDVTLVDGDGNKAISAQEIIPKELFNGGIHAEFSSKMPRFSTFLDIYTRFIVQRASILKNAKALMEGMKEVNVTSFILRDPEYSRALNDNDNSFYRQPVIIVEALDYMNKVLLPLVSREIDG